MADVVLFTTMDWEGGRLAEVRRLTGSVAAARAARPDVAIRHYLLLQRCADVAAARAALDLPEDAYVSVCPGRIPLSAARNLLIDAAARRDVLADETMVGFPDDDGWYPAGVLEYVVARFAADPALDFWFCRYGSDARLQPAAERTAGVQAVLSGASSNTIFLRGRLLRAIGGFDERLGVGTPAGGGEDTDFALRAFLRAKVVRCTPARLIGHRDYDPVFRARYYPGSLGVIARHASRAPGIAAAFVRKLAVGAALVAKREMPVRVYLSAVAGLTRAPAPDPVAPDRPSAIR